MISQEKENRLWLEKQILAREAFRETFPPVLGTSGIPLFYFINTEKLLPDQGQWENYSDDSVAMIRHASAYLKDATFVRVLEILQQKIEQELCGKKFYISGFQRRDWIFSGPLAKKMNLPHLSLYKNGVEEMLSVDSDFKKTSLQDAEDIPFVHVSDLLTKGSSAVSGWIPAMQKMKAKVLLFFSIIDRNQGGKNAIEPYSIPTRALFTLDEAFIQKYASHPNCLAYFLNPEKAVKEYLNQEGALAFLPFFDPSPSNSKLPRALLFWKNWKSCLSPTQMEAFASEFENQYQTIFFSFINQH